MLAFRSLPKHQNECQRQCYLHATALNSIVCSMLSMTFSLIKVLQKFLGNVFGKVVMQEVGISFEAHYQINSWQGKKHVVIVVPRYTAEDRVSYDCDSVSQVQVNNLCFRLSAKAASHTRLVLYYNVGHSSCAAGQHTQSMCTSTYICMSVCQLSWSVQFLCQITYQTIV
jgi:hypothetical protein